MLGGDRRTWGTARLFQEIPSCLRTLRLGTRGLGYSLGTADSVEGVRTREGGTERFLPPCRQLRCPALFLGVEFPTGYLTPGQCRTDASERRGNLHTGSLFPQSTSWC